MRFSFFFSGTVIWLALSAPTIAQAPDLSAQAFGHLVMDPIHEGGVRRNRGINIPINSRAGPEHRLTAGYTASNSYLNPGLLVCADRGRSCQLEYETDHTGNLYYFDWSLPLFNRWEVGLGVSSYRMDEITAWSPAHRLAGDSVLRRFHEDILGEDSLPAISNAVDGRQVFSMTDRAGRELVLAPQHSHWLPLRFSLTRYFSLLQTERSFIALNTGIHLSHPFTTDSGVGGNGVALSRGTDFGLSVNLVRSKRITARVSSTWHLQLARFRTDVHVVNERSPWFSDDRLRSQYGLSWGLSFAGTFSGAAPCSVGLSQLSASALFDKSDYWTWDPLVFEGGNNLRGAILGANDLGLVSFSCTFRGRRMQLALAEDIGGFSQLVGDDGAGTSYDPDFTVSISVSWQLGQRRAQSAAAAAGP